MRTTLTLDPDVAIQLEKLQREKDVSFKEILNQTLRQGLRVINAGAKKKRRYSTPTVALGRCLVGSLDDVAEVLAIAEGEQLK